MLEGFKKFITRGNVIDLAVGIVIGAAFGAVVNQFTKSFIEPLIRIITGGGVEGGTFTISNQVFDYGAFLNAVITFVATAAAIYFFVVVPFNKYNEARARKGEEQELTDNQKMIALLERIATK